MKTLIIVPAKNEERTIEKVVKDLQKERWNHIVVVDDNSEDNTALLARLNGAEVISLPISLGAWGAIQTGMRYALKKGYEIVVTIDADDQHEALYIKELVKEVEQNKTDIVIGAYPDRAHWTKKGLWYILKWISGLNVSDITSGFRAYGLNAIKTLLDTHGLILEYQDVGVLLICKKKKFKIKEIPVKMQNRRYGNSRVFSSYWAIFRYTILTIFYAGINRW